MLICIACHLAAAPKMTQKKQRPLFWNLRFSGFLNALGCGFYYDKLFFIHGVHQGDIGTLFPGPLAFRWTFQFYDQSQTSAELADLLERISPYFLNSVQVFGVIIVEAIVFLALIAMVYRRQEI